MGNVWRFPRTKTFPRRDAVLAALCAALKIPDASPRRRPETSEMHVSALARKLKLPAVWTPVEPNLSSMDFRHFRASLLWPFAVMATAEPCSAASLMFDDVLPDIDTR